MKTLKFQFNQLFFQFYKCKRKLANLQIQNKNVRRQHILEKRILRLFEKLIAMKKTIGISAVAATAVIGLSLASSQTASAQSFAGPQTNPFGLTVQPDSSNFAIPTFADLDGDGDMDMLSGSYNGNFYYYENVGTVTTPAFAPPVKNPFGLGAIPDGYFSVPTFVDLDGDGDMDIISGSYYGNYYYYKNTGTANAPAFAAPVQNPFGIDTIPGNEYVVLPTFVDLDDDGDMDLFAQANYGQFYYYENNGSATAPTFAAPIQNPFGIDTTGVSTKIFPAFADLDNDGDKDLLLGGYNGSLNYYKNSGTASSPAFGTSTSNPFGLQAPANTYLSIPTFVDIDGDGDMDLFCGNDYGNFTYYKNTSTTGIANHQIPGFKVYPNPVVNKLNITAANSVVRVEIYSVDGRLLEKMSPEKNTENISLNFEKYQNGNYLVNVYFRDGHLASKLITKR